MKPIAFIVSESNSEICYKEFIYSVVRACRAEVLDISLDVIDLKKASEEYSFVVFMTDRPAEVEKFQKITSENKLENCSAVGISTSEVENATMMALGAKTRFNKETICAGTLGNLIMQMTASMAGEVNV